MGEVVPRPANHGLYVKSANGLKLRHRRVRRLVAKMHAAMAWLAPADLPACRAWAELEILGARAFAELEENGLTNAAGEPRRLLGEFRQLRQAQLAFERDLGMTPSSRMTLRVGGARARSLDLVASCAAGTDAEDTPRVRPGKVLPAGSRRRTPGPPPPPAPAIPGRADDGAAS